MRSAITEPEREHTDLAAARGQSPVASTAGPEARPAEPGPGLDSLFEDGALPPEIEALLHDGLDRFRLDEPPPGFEEFFGRDGLPTDPFAPGGPLSDGSPLFDRFFPDGLPEDFNELLDRLPGALSGQGDVEGVRDLINRLLDDPDLPPPLRRLLERFESRLAEAG